MPANILMDRLRREEEGGSAQMEAKASRALLILKLRLPPALVEGLRGLSSRTAVTLRLNWLLKKPSILTFPSRWTVAAAWAGT